MRVAAMLKGKQVNPRVSLGIAPGSKQVLAMITQNGALLELITAGARILESTCGFCCGVGQAPRAKAVSLRTNNRNFEGRSGTQDARVYLVSPETAAAAALTGKITDPRDLGLEYPEITLPEQYRIDDQMIIKPSCNSTVQVYRGSNIGAPPVNLPMPNDLRGRVALKLGDKITTDHISPAGPYLKYRSNIPKYSTFVFQSLEPNFSQRCFQIREESLASVIVAGKSYGQGSSREHAALCPMALGVRLVLAKSVERIHSANLINYGILQLTFIEDKDYDRIEDGDEILIKDVEQALQHETVRVLNISKGYTFETQGSYTPRQIEIVLQGGLMNSIRRDV